MNLLTMKVIYFFRVSLITITTEFVDKDDALSKKYGVESPLNSKYYKEGTIHEDEDKN